MRRCVCEQQAEQFFDDDDTDQQNNNNNNRVDTNDDDDDDQWILSYPSIDIIMQENLSIHTINCSTICIFDNPFFR